MEFEHFSKPTLIEPGTKYFLNQSLNIYILFIDSKSVAKDFILLELIDGELNYKWNLNGLNNMVKFVPQVARNELCNSSWIRIKLKKENKGVITLEIK